MLKKIRVVLAIAVIAILTFGFIDFAGVIENPWLQKIQFAPALFSLSITTLIILIVGTLLFGRVYCSVICP
ncbi:MAG: 4Fe-4S binding protein, partial [Bacteroidaceae bacterium]|nr:4Fe-4S binding protein [Bacteroidaceae bacterium]